MLHNEPNLIVMKKALLRRVFNEPLPQFDYDNKKRRIEIEDEYETIVKERIRLDALVLQQCATHISYLDKISFERVNFHLARILRSTYKKDCISLSIFSECHPPEDAGLLQEIHDVALPADRGSHKLKNGRFPHMNLDPDKNLTASRTTGHKREIRVPNDKLKIALTAIWSRFRRWHYLCIQNDNSFNATGPALNVLRKKICRPLLLRKFELSPKYRPDLRLLKRFSPLIREMILPDHTKSYLVCAMWAQHSDRSVSWRRSDIIGMWATIVQCENLRKLSYRGPSYSIDSYDWRTNVTQRLKTIAFFKINDKVSALNLKRWFIENQNIKALFFGDKCLISSQLQELLVPYLNPLIKRLRTIGLDFSTSDDPLNCEQDIFALMLLLSETAFPTIKQIVDGHGALMNALKFWRYISKRSQRWIKLKLMIKKEDQTVQEVDNMNSYLENYSSDVGDLTKPIPIATKYLLFSSLSFMQLFISPLGYVTLKLRSQISVGNQTSVMIFSAAEICVFNLTTMSLDTYRISKR